MDSKSIVFSVLLASIFVSYGWGMRGTIIGGEKGAVLPGAIMGLSVALFVSGGALREYFLYFAAAGACSMFFGGTETYGQTLGFLLKRNEAGEYAGKLYKGVFGIFIKGGIWFCISGLILAMLPGALAGVYKPNDIILMFALFPIVSLLGTRILNFPYDREKGVFPKIYFSLDRREEWGGNVFIIILLSVFALLRKDYFALGAGFCGFVTGGVGFLGGLIFYDMALQKYGKNKKRIFGSLSKKGMIDGWKIMEHTFGAVAGGGLMLYFCLNSQKLKQLSGNIDLSSLFLGKDKYIFAVIPFILLSLTAAQYPIIAFIERRTGKKADIHFFELLERPFWSALPLIFVFCGAPSTAAFGSFILPLYALCEKCSLEWFKNIKNKMPLRILYASLMIILSLWFFAYGTLLTIPRLFLFYTFPYVLSVAIDFFSPRKVAEYKKGGKSLAEVFGSSVMVFGHFVLECIVILTAVFFFS